jgi:outer membrane protein OmpA-like peptidoglycan-associated protein
MNSAICKRAALGSLLLAMGCASSGPTTELVDARRAYDQARMGPAKDLAPDRLQGARDALEQAERAHADDAGSRKERDLAYIATRKSELATAYGQLASDQRLRKQQEQAYIQTQDRMRKNAEQRAESTERSLQAATGALARTQSELSGERERRTAAEQRADAAVQSLRQIASVQEESRGLVITLEGAVLFTTGKSELLPLAQQKLDQVAEALKQSESTKIVVEGYTDSRGADDANMRLSQTRAEAVRSYLVSKGVKAESITAVGRGEDRPIASNDTPEGRANNRRVEIIVQPPTGQNQAKPAATTSPAGNTTSGSTSAGATSGSASGNSATGSSTSSGASNTPRNTPAPR